MDQTSKTKRILYVFNATTHYYNLVLNKLNRETEYEIEIVVPSDVGGSVGAGVFQTDKNLEILIHRLPERKSKIFGTHLNGLDQLLKSRKPQVVVVIDSYLRGICMHPNIRRVINEQNIKVIFKSIPFRILNYMNPINLLFKLLTFNWEQFGFLGTLKRVILMPMHRRMFSQCADAHVCYIEKAYDIYGSYGVAKEKIFITYNSPDTDTLLKVNEELKNEKPFLPFHPHRLIHVGRLVDWKRLDLIIEAMNELRTKYHDIELLVIGNGPKKEDWERLAVDRGLGKQVKFLGGIYDLKQLGAYQRASAIYVLGGMGGLSINDAMCFERPVLCSVGDGTEVKLVRDGFNGYFFKEGNAQDLAQKIDLIFSEDRAVERMGSNSVSIIKNEVNIQKVIKGYTDAFKYVLKD